MAATVTIDRGYFETLLRRAELHASGKDLSTPLDLPMVTIPKVDHDGLLQIAQEYAALRNALFAGGIPEETLTVLINSDVSFEPAPETATMTQSETPAALAGKEIREFGHDSNGTARPPALKSANYAPPSGDQKFRSGDQQYSYSYDESYSPPDTENRESLRPSELRYEKSHLPRNDQRTIRLKNLSDRVSHKDIVGIIRGGQILDIFLRPGERIASVSFVEGSAAQAFITHARRNDIYLLGKRVDVSWNDRQFTLPGHVAAKINTGATRNLLVRKVQDGITEERIRADLDHIHNLVVVDISFSGGDAYIFLNSVHNAIYARTCMMSRTAYRGSKIEFYADECALELPRDYPPSRKPKAKGEPKKTNSTLNRFQMLNIDGTEDESEDNDAESTIFSSPKNGHYMPAPVVV